MGAIYEELRIALHNIWARRWWVLGAAWAIAALGWLFLSMIPNTYESRARVLVESNDFLPEDMARAGGSKIAQVRQTLTSARNLEQVALQTGLIGPDSDQRARDNAVGMLRDKITVVAEDNNVFALTSLMSVGSIGDRENARLAPAVLNTLVKVFRTEQSRGGAMTAAERIKFIDAQIVEREGQLRQIEGRRAQFEAQHIGMLPSGGGTPSMRIDQARSELAQVESQLAAAQGGLAAVNAQLSSTPATVAGSGGAGGPGFAKQQLASAQGELAGMYARGLTNAHPDVIALKSQIEALKIQAQREPATGGVGSSPNPLHAQLVAQRAERASQVSALSTRRAQLNSEINAVTALRIKEPGVAAQYERLNADYTVLKEQYDKLLAQREQLKLQGRADIQADPIRVEMLVPPTVPTTPVAPNRPLLMTGVLLAAIGAGLGLGFGLGQLRSSFPTAARLERASGMPVIGSISALTGPDTVATEARQKRLAIIATAALIGLFIVLLAYELTKQGGAA